MRVNNFGTTLLIYHVYLARYIYCNVNMIQTILTDQNYSTVKCLNSILESLPCGTRVTFINPNGKDNEVIRNANTVNICHSIHTRSFDVDDSDWYIWTTAYVITADDFPDLWSGLMLITRDVFWNPRAKMIVQVNDLKDEEGVQKVFQLLNKYNIFNVVVIQFLQNDAAIYTYKPSNNNHCGKIDKIILETCENFKNLNYFTENIVSDLKNCTIRVVASDDVPNFISKSSNYTVYGKFVSGLEQYVLDTIAMREEFSIEYEVFNDEEVFYGVVLPNRTSTGLLNYIDSDLADVAAGGYILMKNRVELFDYLYGFNYASFNLFTPTIKGQVWKRLYKEFGISTWFLISTALILVMILCQVLKKTLNDNTCSILNVWGYFFGNANAGMSRNRRFRTIIFFWSWFTFFITSFYNTALFSLISVHVHETPHSINADDLKTLPYKPCISDNSRMIFQFAFNQTLPEGEPIHNCTFTDGALHYVANTKKYYAIEMEYSYSLKEYEYLDKDGKPDLESWGFSSSNVIVIYLKRGFRFKEIFQKYASRMFEAGLIKNHLQTIHLRSYSVIKRRPKEFKNTTMIDLCIHFYILLAGYALSLICFSLEVWYHYVTHEEKYNRKRK